MNIYPYVYRIDHLSGEFYIGSRAANTVPAAMDFGHIYKTSTKKLSHPFKEYTQTIVAEFFLPSGKVDAYDFEQALIYENWGDYNLANQHCTHGKTRFSTAGQKHSDETKKKISEATRGKARTPLSEETKAKMSATHRSRVRKPHSAETKQKMSEAQRGKPGRKQSEETKRKLSEARRGKICSVETKAKISAARRAAI